MFVLARHTTAPVALATGLLLLAGCSGEAPETSDSSSIGTAASNEAVGSGGPTDPAGVTDSTGATEARNRGPARARGVVLIVADTLRADRLGCYGYPRDTSPNIDALAARGGRWSRNVAQGMWTVPSMLSMMTGRELVKASNAVPANVPTLAQLVAEAGVETAAFVGNPVAGASRGLARGFDHYEVDETGTTDGPDWVARFADWHGARTSDERPWFAWLQFMDTHSPFDPPEGDRRFDTALPRVDQDLVGARWEGARRPTETVNADHPDAWSFERAREYMVEQSNLYDGEVAVVDRAVADLVAYLEDIEALDDTLIVFAADHGEMLWEVATHHYMIARRRDDGGGALARGVADVFASGHTFWFHPPVAMTPLIMAGPGIPVGVHDDLSANLDIVPTVLESLDLEPLATAQGRSKFHPSEPRDALFGRGRLGEMVLRDDGLQLVRLRERISSADPNPRWEFRLRDHRSTDWHTDIGEQRSEDLEALKQRMVTWRRGDSLPPVEEVDASALEALRRFGYIEGDDE